MENLTSRQEARMTNKPLQRKHNHEEREIFAVQGDEWGVNSFNYRSTAAISDEETQLTT